VHQETRAEGGAGAGGEQGQEGEGQPGQRLHQGELWVHRETRAEGEQGQGGAGQEGSRGREGRVSRDRGFTRGNSGCTKRQEQRGDRARGRVGREKAWGQCKGATQQRSARSALYQLQGHACVWRAGVGLHLCRSPSRCSGGLHSGQYQTPWGTATRTGRRQKRWKPPSHPSQISSSASLIPSPGTTHRTKQQRHATTVTLLYRTVLHTQRRDPPGLMDHRSTLSKQTRPALYRDQPCATQPAGMPGTRAD